MGRDVFNEKPSTEEQLAADAAGVGASSLPRGAVLHTTKVRHKPCCRRQCLWSCCLHCCLHLGSAVHTVFMDQATEPSATRAQNHFWKSKLLIFQSAFSMFQSTSRVGSLTALTTVSCFLALVPRSLFCKIKLKSRLILPSHTPWHSMTLTLPALSHSLPHTFHLTLHLTG
jgi:hypothetical protein